MEHATKEQFQSKVIDIFHDQPAIEIDDADSDPVKGEQLEVDQVRTVRSISEFVSRRLAGS